MSAWKRTDSQFYWATIAGKAVSLRTTSLARAREREAELRDIETRVRLGLTIRNLNPFGLTLAEAALEHLAGPAARQAQLDRLADTLGKHVVRDEIGALRLEQVTRGAVVEWLERRERTSNLSAATCNRLRSNLSAIFSALIEREKFLGPNPCTGVRLRKEQQPEGRGLPYEVVLPLVEHMPSKDWQRAAAIAAFTGMRMGEIRALQWQDVDLAKRMLRVQKSKTGVKRDVALHAELVELLAPFAKKTGPVVGHIAWSKASTIVRNALTRAGLEMDGATFHGLRGAWATRMQDCGADPFAIRLMGWGASRRDVMASHYLRPIQALIDAVDKLTFEVPEVVPLSSRNESQLRSSYGGVKK